MFAVYGLLNVVQTGATAVGSVGYTGLETIGVVSSGPSQKNINNEKNNKRLRRAVQIATQKEEQRLVNSKKRNDAQKKKVANNKKNQEEELKKEKAREINTLQQLKPELNNTKLKLSIGEKKIVINAANEIIKFVEELIELVNNGTTCYKITEYSDIVDSLLPILQNNKYIPILNKLEFFKNAFDNTIKHYEKEKLITKSWVGTPLLESVKNIQDFALYLSQEIAKQCGIQRIVLNNALCIRYPSSSSPNIFGQRAKNEKKRTQAISNAVYNKRQELPQYRDPSRLRG